MSSFKGGGGWCGGRGRDVGGGGMEGGCPARGVWRGMRGLPHKKRAASRRLLFDVKEG